MNEWLNKIQDRFLTESNMYKFVAIGFLASIVATLVGGSDVTGSWSGKYCQGAPCQPGSLLIVEHSGYIKKDGNIYSCPPTVESDLIVPRIGPPVGVILIPRTDYLKPGTCSVTLKSTPTP